LVSWQAEQKKNGGDDKMKTALVTDGKYRSSIAAVRALHRAGYRVVVTQTRADVKSAPAVSVSKSCDDFRWIDGACADADYAEKLLSVLKEYEHPVLFCVGAVTLNTVAARREEFAALANFLIAPKETLDALNDKESVHQRALELGIPVPREYDGTPESYPVVVKPHCGEKFGLKAANRYAVANNEAEFDAIMEKMQRYDPSPIVQQKITGAGAGVSLLLGRESELLAPVRERADYVINTTGLTLSMLQKRICEIFVDGGTRRDILINVVAFGFKYGIPIDADLVFDVRFLPNPYYVEKLRPLSGMDDEVQEYVLRSDVAQRFLEKLTGMIDFLLPQYAAEGRYALTIGIGCTGGQHRSVAVAKALTDYLAARDANVRLRNRDFPRT
jgi:hypothetical protein